MDLESAADELYGLDPELFTERRGELVAQARELGDRSLASEIGKLRRASVAAWLINQLPRQHPEQLDKLSEFAARLRAAHLGLQGSQLRELSGERQQVLGSLTELLAKWASDADRAPTDAVLQQVRQTLEAAIADENAESAIRSGRLTAALSYIGFGDVDLSNAVALPDRRPFGPSRPRLRSVPALPPDDDAAEPANDATGGSAENAGDESRGAAALARAEQAAAEAAEQVSDAERDSDRVTQRHALAEQRLQDLQGRIEHARTARDDAAEQLKRAQRRLDNAQSHQQKVDRLLKTAQRKHAPSAEPNA